MKEVIVNCRNFRCRYNEKGDCKLERITLQSEGTPIVNKLVYVEAEEKEDEAV